MSQKDLAELNRQLKALQRSIADLEQGGIDEGMIAPLRQQADALRARIETGGGNFVGRDQQNVEIAGRGNIVGDGSSAMVVEGDLVLAGHAAARLLRTLRPRRSTANLQHAAAEHLRCLLDRHRYLNLRGMGVADRVPLRLPLLDLYVPLQARGELPAGETWRREGLRLAGRELDEQNELLASRLGQPQPVLDLLREHDGLIILGDPGAGKTTFVKYLALQLARGQEAELGLGPRLPVLVPLSAYATALAEDDVRLDDFIADYLCDAGSNLPVADLLEQALQEGRALVLLDGLDEVKAAGQRQTVADRVIDFFTYHRRAGNKFVLTSRIVGYREVRPVAEGLVECTLVDFDDDEIAAFVEKWTAALEQQAQGEGTTAERDAARERSELLAAIHGSPAVRQLAANPLLLTILALMKRQGVRLPDRRVELYDRYVETLLSSWNRARSLGRPPTRDLDARETVRVLAPVALWMHEANPGVGLVKREELRRQLETIYHQRGAEQPEAAGNQFLADVREHAGLLLERGPGEYGFIHLTFEEYLSGVAIAQLGQQDVGPVVDYLADKAGEAAWEEVSRLAVAYMGIVQQREQAAGAVLEQLLDRTKGTPEGVVLAGSALLDAWPGGATAEAYEQVIAALVPTMQGQQVAPLLRRRAGLLLGRLGWIPPDMDEFIAIAPRPFRYGDGKEPLEIGYRYWIGQYPVTNLQYARFVADSGYERREFWNREGWAWREREGRTAPAYWADADWNNPLFPVVGVTWYEAAAYCRWLTAELQARKGSPLPAEYVARLPTEEEWERAARGTDGREYPWGDGFAAWRANTEESDVEERRGIGTTAVCTYPGGVGPAGLWDAAGNVWEWTVSPWQKGSSERVVRGGSWFGDLRDARCACRGRYGPGGWGSTFGFRVVLSPVL